MAATAHSAVSLAAGGSAPLSSDGQRAVSASHASREYLEDSVVPVLVQGLKVLVRERPENPVDYLAMYLLKHNPKSNVSVEVPVRPLK